MQNTSTGSLDDAQLQTRAASVVIETASTILAKQLMALVAIYQAQQVIKPIAVCCIMSPPPVLVRLTHRHAPWASLLLLARVAAPPARSSVRCRAACPHVRHSLQPTLEAPREGLRQGEVQGGLEGS